MAAILLLGGCSGGGDGSDSGSNNDGNDDDTHPPPAITLTPASIDATADLSTAGTRTDLDLTALSQATGLDASVGLEGISSESPSARVIFRQWFTDDQNHAALRYSEFNFDTGGFAALATASSSSVISRDGNAVAWLEPDNCTLWYQSLQPAAEPVRINDSLREFACPRVPSLSADGSTVWFDQGVGRYDGDGVLRFDRFDRAEYSVAIVRPAMQSVIELASSLQPLGDPELDALSRSIGYEVSSSHDGQRLVFKAYFLPAPVSDYGVHDYVIGTLLVDTATGEITLLNRNRYTRFYSEKVQPSIQDSATLSGAGTVVWYLESDGITTNEAIAPSLLKRRDLNTGQVTTLVLPGFKDSLFSNADGSALLFQLDGEVVVYRHASQDLLRTHTALKFCTDPDDENTCTFDASSRYVLNDPAMISDEGRTVLIRILSQRPNIDTPQNTQELMLLDVASGTLQRLAPDQDVLFTAMTPLADRIVFLTEWSDTGEYLGRNRAVVVRR